MANYEIQRSPGDTRSDAEIINAFKAHLLAQQSGQTGKQIRPLGYAGRDKELDVFDALGNVADNPGHYIPFISLGFDLKDAWGNYQLASRVKDGTATMRERSALKEMLIERGREKTLGFKVMSGILELIPIVVEFAASFGIAAGIRKGIAESVEYGAKKTVTGIGKRVAREAGEEAIDQIARASIRPMTKFGMSIGRQVGKVMPKSLAKNPLIMSLLKSDYATKLGQANRALFQKRMAGMTIGRAANEAATEVGEKSAKRLVGKYALQSFLMDPALMLAATPVSAYVTEDIIKNMTDKYGLNEDQAGNLHLILQQEGDDFLPAWSQATTRWMIESASERTAEALMMGASLLGPTAFMNRMKQGWLGAILNKADNHPKIKRALFGDKDAASWIQRAGWHGVVPELFEEAVAGVAMAATPFEEFGLPEAEDVIAMGLSFALNPVSLMTGISAGLTENYNPHFKKIKSILDDARAKEGLNEKQSARIKYDAGQEIMAELRTLADKFTAAPNTGILANAKHWLEMTLVGGHYNTAAEKLLGFSVTEYAQHMAQNRNNPNPEMRTPGKLYNDVANTIQVGKGVIVERERGALKTLEQLGELSLIDGMLVQAEEGGTVVSKEAKRLMTTHQVIQISNGTTVGETVEQFTAHFKQPPRSLAQYEPRAIEKLMSFDTIEAAMKEVPDLAKMFIESLGYRVSSLEYISPFLNGIFQAKKPVLLQLAKDKITTRFVQAKAFVVPAEAKEAVMKEHPGLHESQFRVIQEGPYAGRMVVTSTASTTTTDQQGRPVMNIPIANITAMQSESTGVLTEEVLHAVHDSQMPMEMYFDTESQKENSRLGIHKARTSVLKSVNTQLKKLRGKETLSSVEKVRLHALTIAQQGLADIAEGENQIDAQTRQQEQMAELHRILILNDYYRNADVYEASMLQLGPKVLGEAAYEMLASVFNPVYSDLLAKDGSWWNENKDRYSDKWRSEWENSGSIPMSPYGARIQQGAAFDQTTESSRKKAATTSDDVGADTVVAPPTTPTKAARSDAAEADKSTKKATPQETDEDISETEVFSSEPITVVANLLADVREGSVYDGPGKHLSIDVSDQVNAHAALSTAWASIHGLGATMADMGTPAGSDGERKALRSQILAKLRDGNEKLTDDVSREWGNSVNIIQKYLTKQFASLLKTKGTDPYLMAYAINRVISELEEGKLNALFNRAVDLTYEQVEVKTLSHDARNFAGIYAYENAPISDELEPNMDTNEEGHFVLHLNSIRRQIADFGIPVGHDFLAAISDPLTPFEEAATFQQAVLGDSTSWAQFLAYVSQSKPEFRSLFASVPQSIWRSAFNVYQQIRVFPVLGAHEFKVEGENKGFINFSVLNIHNVSGATINRLLAQVRTSISNLDQATEFRKAYNQLKKTSADGSKLKGTPSKTGLARTLNALFGVTAFKAADFGSVGGYRFNEEVILTQLLQILEAPFDWTESQQKDLELNNDDLKKSASQWISELTTESIGNDTQMKTHIVQSVVRQIKNAFFGNAGVQGLIEQHLDIPMSTRYQYMYNTPRGTSSAFRLPTSAQKTVDKDPLILNTFLLAPPAGTEKGVDSVSLDIMTYALFNSAFQSSGLGGRLGIATMELFGDKTRPWVYSIDMTDAFSENSAKYIEDSYGLQEGIVTDEMRAVAWAWKIYSDVAKANADAPEFFFDSFNTFNQRLNELSAEQVENGLIKSGETAKYNAYAAVQTAIKMRLIAAMSGKLSQYKGKKGVTPLQEVMSRLHTMTTPTSRIMDPAIRTKFGDKFNIIFVDYDKSDGDDIVMNEAWDAIQTYNKGNSTAKMLTEITDDDGNRVLVKSQTSSERSIDPRGQRKGHRSSLSQLLVAVRRYNAGKDFADQIHKIAFKNAAKVIPADATVIPMGKTSQIDADAITTIDLSGVGFIHSTDKGEAGFSAAKVPTQLPSVLSTMGIHGKQAMTYLHEAIREGINQYYNGKELPTALADKLFGLGEAIESGMIAWDDPRFSTLLQTGVVELDNMISNLANKMVSVNVMTQSDVTSASVQQQGYEKGQHYMLVDSNIKGLRQTSTPMAKEDAIEFIQNNRAEHLDLYVLSEDAEYTDVINKDALKDVGNGMVVIPGTSYIGARVPLTSSNMLVRVRQRQKIGDGKSPITNIIPEAALITGKDADGDADHNFGQYIDPVTNAPYEGAPLDSDSFEIRRKKLFNKAMRYMELAFIKAEGEDWELLTRETDHKPIISAIVEARSLDTVAAPMIDHGTVMKIRNTMVARDTNIQTLISMNGGQQQLVSHNVRLRTQQEFGLAVPGQNKKAKLYFGHKAIDASVPHRRAIAASTIDAFIQVSLDASKSSLYTGLDLNPESAALIAQYIEFGSWKSEAELHNNIALILNAYSDIGRYGWESLNNLKRTAPLLKSKAYYEKKSQAIDRSRRTETHKTLLQLRRATRFLHKINKRALSGVVDAAVMNQELRALLAGEDIDWGDVFKVNANKRIDITATDSMGMKQLQHFLEQVETYKGNSVLLSDTGAAMLAAILTNKQDRPSGTISQADLQTIDTILKRQLVWYALSQLVPEVSNMKEGLSELSIVVGKEYDALLEQFPHNKFLLNLVHRVKRPQWEPWAYTTTSLGMGINGGVVAEYWKSNIRQAGQKTNFGYMKTIHPMLVSMSNAPESPYEKNAYRDAWLELPEAFRAKLFLQQMMFYGADYTSTDSALKLLPLTLYSQEIKEAQDAFISGNISPAVLLSMFEGVQESLRYSMRRDAALKRDPQDVGMQKQLKGMMPVVNPDHVTDPKTLEFLREHNGLVQNAETDAFALLRGFRFAIGDEIQRGQFRYGHDHNVSMNTIARMASHLGARAREAGEDLDVQVEHIPNITDALTPQIRTWMEAPEFIPNQFFANHGLTGPMNAGHVRDWIANYRTSSPKQARQIRDALGYAVYLHPFQRTFAGNEIHHNMPQSAQELTQAVTALEARQLSGEMVDRGLSEALEAFRQLQNKPLNDVDVLALMQQAEVNGISRLLLTGNELLIDERVMYSSVSVQSLIEHFRKESWYPTGQIWNDIRRRDEEAQDIIHREMTNLQALQWHLMGKGTPLRAYPKEIDGEWRVIVPTYNEDFETDNTASITKLVTMPMKYKTFWAAQMEAIRQTSKSTRAKNTKKQHKLAEEASIALTTIIQQRAMTAVEKRKLGGRYVKGYVLDDSRRVQKDTNGDYVLEYGSVAKLRKEFDAQFGKGQFNKLVAGAISIMSRFRDKANQMSKHIYASEDWISDFDGYVLGWMTVGNSKHPLPEQVRRASTPVSPARPKSHSSYYEAMLKGSAALSTKGEPMFSFTLDATALMERWIGTVWNRWIKRDAAWRGLLGQDEEGLPLYIPVFDVEKKTGQPSSDTIPAQYLQIAYDNLYDVMNARIYTETYEGIDRTALEKGVKNRDATIYEKWNRLITSSKATNYLTVEHYAESIDPNQLNTSDFSRLYIRHRSQVRKLRLHIQRQIPLKLFHSPKFHPAVRALMHVNQWQKAMRLSFSFFHPFSLIESGISNEGLQLSQLNPGHWITMIAKHNAALANLRADEDLAAFWASHNLSFQAHNPNFDNTMIFKDLDAMAEAWGAPGSAIRTFFGGYQKMVNKKLWRTMLPAMKITAAETMLTEAKRRIADMNIPNADIDTIARDIGSHINNAFGGQNWDTMLWSTPKMRAIMNMSWFSFDWTYSAASVAGLRKIFPGLSPGPSQFSEEWMATKYWPAMMTLVMTTAPALLQMMIFSAWGDPDKGDTPFPFMNESIKNGWFGSGIAGHIDLTPAFRTLQEKYAWADSLWDEGTTGSRRMYVRFAKQATEIFEGWFEDPLRQALVKMSPIGQNLYSIISGDTPSGWALDFKEQNFWKSFFVGENKGVLGGRIAHIAKQFTPLGITNMLQGKPTSFIAPTSKGISATRASKELAGLLATYATSDKYEGVLGRPMDEYDLGSIGVEILEGAARNGHDPDAVLRDARGTVVRKYYRDLYEAIQDQNWADAQEAVHVLVKLNAGFKRTEASMKSRFNRSSQLDWTKADSIRLSYLYYEPTSYPRNQHAFEGEMPLASTY